ncbi:hypothetical protein, partial [Comamonas sp. JC664]|uniref:hypothetical protein n=1 Tax=Comamonas sp. JC664 TaxID=2801917 RepID=UPI0036219CA8
MPPTGVLTGGVQRLLAWASALLPQPAAHAADALCMPAAACPFAGCHVLTGRRCRCAMASLVLFRNSAAGAADRAHRRPDSRAGMSFIF